MTLILEIPAEAQSRLEVAAQERGQATDEYVCESFQIWSGLITAETEGAFEVARALSLPTLGEHWTNEHDAVYDNP